MSRSSICIYGKREFNQEPIRSKAKQRLVGISYEAFLSVIACMPICCVGDKIGWRKIS
jgi:hypothetical protein